MDVILTDGDRSDYRIHVYTGNRLGASTRADIRLILYGDQGRTEEIPLTDSRNHKIKFQKGQVWHHENVSLYIIILVVENGLRKVLECIKRDSQTANCLSCLKPSYSLI